ncbi:hypothetical protein ACEPAI_7013 [Sanghuangporus weigelae]
MVDATTESFDEDALFLERLDVFLEKSLNDLREFARRECRDFEQIRLKAAEWHSRYLFDSVRSESRTKVNTSNALTIVNDVLLETSRALESLESAAGRHSLLLVVDPASSDDVDDGFLGGTTTGREFWRGLRHGGSAGARNFKEYCRNVLGFPLGGSISKSSGQTPAGIMKNNLYTEMRSRLRAISGVRNAEMKWTKPDKLSVYGVALEGWPRNIVYKNPSKMTFNETSLLMKMLQENALYFRSLRDSASIGLPRSDENTSSAIADVSWALNEDNNGFDTRTDK